ncbi:hypothetical protein R9X44_05185 [Actinocorallia sp. A-T 12471]|nr:hypothetical protein [Actinocorallia sp. A-T 12471]MDX6739147.1 hypothetical protein [Actinocorallia sp. A-T 12471]
MTTTDRTVGNWPRAIMMSMTTPRYLNSSSLVGAASAGPQAAANSGPPSFAASDSTAPFTGMTRWTAPSPPQANASAKPSGECCSNTSSERRNHTNGTVYSVQTTAPTSTAVGTIS